MSSHCEHQPFTPTDVNAKEILRVSLAETPSESSSISLGSKEHEVWIGPVSCWIT